MDERAHGGQRQHIRLEPQRSFAAVEQECVVGDLPFGAEPGAVDPLQCAQFPLHHFAPRAQRGVGEGQPQRCQINLAATIEHAPRIV